MSDGTDGPLGEDEATRLTRTIGAATGWLGSFPAIFISVALVVVWFVGAFFVTGRFRNNTYQLLINTGTTIITFVMVFIIQNTQNRDGKALQTKLDAIIRHLDLDPKLVGLEEAPEKAISEEQERVRRQPEP